MAANGDSLADIATRQDVEIRDAVWEPLSKKAQIDQLRELMEAQAAVPPDAPLGPESLKSATSLVLFESATTSPAAETPRPSASTRPRTARASSRCPPRPLL